MSDLAKFLARRGRYNEAEHWLQEVVKLSTEQLQDAVSHERTRGRADEEWQV